jgi:hypothetical protein
MPLDVPGCLWTFLAAFGRSWLPVLPAAPWGHWSPLAACLAPISYSGSILALDLSESRSCLKLGRIPVVPAGPGRIPQVLAASQWSWPHLETSPQHSEAQKVIVSFAFPLFTGNYICD